MSIYSIAKMVSQIRPGESIRVSMNLLGAYTIVDGYNGCRWTPPELVMENIVGSAYEFRYHEDWAKQVVVFERLDKPLTDGSRTYISPDQRSELKKWLSN